MIKLSIKNVIFNYLNYYNKLILNKKIQINYKKKKKKNYKIRFNKVSNSNIVSLRAPKHFKVGRHHYHVICQKFSLKFINFKKFTFILKIALYKYLNILISFIKKKKITKIMSILLNFKITLTIKDTFYIV